MVQQPDTTIRRVAIMQPYFFPYIGYYQLVHAVDTFVFYDDVHFINRGWINRNRILINGQPTYITVSLQGASQNKLIRDIPLVDNREKILRSIEMAYRKAPFFTEAMVPITEVLTGPAASIGELARRSVTVVMDHLGVQREYLVSGDRFAHTSGLPRADRLIAITKECGSSHYINALGGRELYEKGYFRGRGVHLDFLETELPSYRQFAELFQPALSMVDVLMFNEPSRVADMLDHYRLI